MENNALVVLIQENIWVSYPPKIILQSLRWSRQSDRGIPETISGQAHVEIIQLSIAAVLIFQIVVCLSSRLTWSINRSNRSNSINGSNILEHTTSMLNIKRRVCCTSHLIQRYVFHSTADHTFRCQLTKCYGLNHTYLTCSLEMPTYQ